MRRLRWMGTLLLETALGFSATAAVPAAPLLALWEHATSASLEVDSPRLVIYQDGRVIAQRPPHMGPARGEAAETSAPFVTAQLELAQVNVWYDDIFAIAREEDLKGRYVLGGREAGRAATFYFQAGAHGLLVTVEGLSPRALSPYGALLEPAAEEVPARLLRIYQDALGLKLNDVTRWAPEWFEARFRPATGDVASAAAWPTQWPSPLQPGGALDPVLAVRSGQLQAAPEFRGAVHTWHLVAVDSRRVQVALRPVLPGEETWRRHIAADADAVRAAHAAESRAQLGAERDHVRTAFQERVAAPASGPVATQPTVETLVPPYPELDRPSPSLSPLPRTPDPPNPKSKRSR